MTQNRVTFECDWQSETTVTTAVVDAVATIRGCAPTALDPLEEAIDTDALNQIFKPTTRTDRTSGELSFVFEGCDVTVTADGTIEVLCQDD